LKRRGLSSAEIQNIYRAYRSIFFGSGTLSERVARTADANRGDERVMRMVEFIGAGKRRLTIPRHNNDDSD
jgi:acyl-[acyl carrier protein]--UDP-N-acetylglucosamine O-acyltransferase